MKEEMRRQLEQIRKAYDLTVEYYYKKIDPFEAVADEFKKSDEFKDFLKSSDPLITGSSAPVIKEFLNPKPGMRFLDVGCGANLANYRLDKWPSRYYGIDISHALIKAMKDFISQKQIAIGGLWVADASDLPFDDDFIDICSVIGVFEYCTLNYIKESLTELNRVLRSESKIVVDIPNPEHRYVAVMMQIEEYLGRPNILHPRSVFEKVLTHLFLIERCDDSQVMLKYFAETIK